MVYMLFVINMVIEFLLLYQDFSRLYFRVHARIFLSSVRINLTGFYKKNRFYNQNRGLFAF